MGRKLYVVVAGNSAAHITWISNHGPVESMAITYNHETPSVWSFPDFHLGNIPFLNRQREVQFSPFRKLVHSGQDQLQSRREDNVCHGVDSFIIALVAIGLPISEACSTQLARW